MTTSPPNSSDVQIAQASHKTVVFSPSALKESTLQLFLLCRTRIRIGVDPISVQDAGDNEATNFQLNSHCPQYRPVDLPKRWLRVTSAFSHISSLPY
ncbi:hypothetical protein CDAR_218731 [Caerostris darwini]|uniref:Uncharacterized protein n=1 Tax=Caerostris darwini TaxID=1538125 RepID=A0AAV4UG30_9ARAC|nr:hypothetical protein CDAR_218731 [Caerostris darwini]